MTGPFDTSAADSIAQRVAVEVGGLNPDEFAVVYGAAAAAQVHTPAQLSQHRTLSWLIQAVGRLRSGPCGWCGGDMTRHAIDIGESGVEVRCLKDARHWRVDLWALGPAPAPPNRTIIAFLAWMVLPFVSLGLLSWAMPLTAGAMRNNRIWTAAACVLFLCLAAGFVVPESSESNFLIAAWLGGTVYGALQIKPWLRGFPQVVAQPEWNGDSAPGTPNATGASPAHGSAGPTFSPRYPSAQPDPGTPPAYAPGDVVNGHYLGHDNTWHPL